MTERKIPIYDERLSLMTIQSYLSANNLLCTSLVKDRKAVYVLKNHGGRISLEQSLPEGRTSSGIWTVTFSDRVDGRIVEELSSIIKKRNEIIREEYKGRAA